MTAANAGTYCVVATGACDSVTNCATLAVNSPTTASGPTDLIQCPGQTADFSVTPSGTGSFTYQWSKDGTDISGATNVNLSIASANVADVGNYCVVVTGACDSVTNCATLTVTDTTPPSVSCSAVPGANANNTCRAPVPNVLGGVSASDDCTAGAAITLSQFPTAGTLVGVGTHTITVTATDASGNRATCTTTFTVTDTTAPSVSCSSIPSAGADANCQGTVPDVLGGVSVSDNCTPTGAITLSQSPAAGTIVGLGTHTITVTATDASGNSATCTASFTVADTTAPSVICTAVPSASADANCQAAVPNVLGGVTVSDNCTAASAITLIGRSVARSSRAAMRSLVFCTKSIESNVDRKAGRSRRRTHLRM